MPVPRCPQDKGGTLQRSDEFGVQVRVDGSYRNTSLFQWNIWVREYGFSSQASGAVSPSSEHKEPARETRAGSFVTAEEMTTVISIAGGNPLPCHDHYTEKVCGESYIDVTVLSPRMVASSWLIVTTHFR
jgi:hypothetical protein